MFDTAASFWGVTSKRLRISFWDFLCGELHLMNPCTAPKPLSVGLLVAYDSCYGQDLCSSAPAAGSQSRCPWDFGLGLLWQFIRPLDWTELLGVA